MEELTPRQAQILRFIEDAIEENGCPPTLVEIARTFGFHSHNSAVEHLKALARKGAIELAGGAARGIRLKAERGVPLVGRVELVAENPDYPPIVVDLKRDELAIEGSCVGIIRSGRAL